MPKISGHGIDRRRPNPFNGHAEVWERLADQQEQGSDLSEAPAPPSPGSEQPVVQQQQQVQPKDEDKDD